jgi:hypothetical protein
MKRLAIATLLLWTAFAPALAQAPVPALPDTQRLTAYTISGSTCACAVNFAIYGDGTDFGNWVEIWLNGINVSNTDPIFGWTLTSPSGSLGSIARPITDAIITFNNVQTGTVQIVGARRPRRTTQFSESQGVTARQFNQALTDIVAQNRETWDKTNDLTGRTIVSQPGNIMKPLPPPANCVNLFLSFGADGLTPTCGVGGTMLSQFLFTNSPDQLITGGVNVTTLVLASGNITMDCGLRPLQSISNGANFTITAPANDGSCLLLVTNVAGAGAVSFAGFSVGANTGDSLDATVGHKFTLNIWRIAGVSGYRVAALQ